MQFKALNLQHPGGSRVRWYKNKPQQTSVRTGTEQSSAALSTQDNPVHFQPTLCIYRQLSSLALIKKKNLEGEFVAESWIAQCCKQLWKFTPFLQKITHQNHFHQHFSASSLCSLSRAPTALCYHLLYAARSPLHPFHSSRDWRSTQKP